MSQKQSDYKKATYHLAEKYLKELWVKEGTQACACIDLCECFETSDQSWAKLVSLCLKDYICKIRRGTAYASAILQPYFDKNAIQKIRQLVLQLFSGLPEKLRVKSSRGRVISLDSGKKSGKCISYVPDAKGNLVVA